MMAHEKEFDAFERHMEGTSMVERVLKAHLIIEDKLVEALKMLLPHPGHIDAEAMGFQDKVRLCGALGFFSEYEVAAFQALNTLRNDIAHQLDSEISMADIRQIVNHFEPELRAEVKAILRDGQGTARYLQLIVGVLYMQVRYVVAKPLVTNINTPEMNVKQPAIVDFARKYGIELGVVPDPDLEHASSRRQ